MTALHFIIGESEAPAGDSTAHSLQSRELRARKPGAGSTPTVFASTIAPVEPVSPYRWATIST